MARAPVRAHADQLEHVAGALRVVERSQVVGVVRVAVALEGGEHREGGVGGCERLRVAGSRCDLERTLGVRPTRLGVRAKPMGPGPPSEDERDVSRRAVLARPPVRRHRLVQAAAQLFEQAHAPGERRRQRLGVAGGAMEAAQGLVPVAADLKRLAGELLDRAVAQVGRQQADGAEHAVDDTVREERRPVRAQQAGELGGVACLGQAAQRLLELVVLLEPARRPQPQIAGFGLVGEPRGGELTHRLAERVPARRMAVELDEEPAPGQRAEDLPGPLDPERLAELGREALERRDDPHQRLDLRRLVGEDLGREVGEEGAVRTPNAVERVAATVRRDAAQRLDREPHGRGPPARRSLELFSRLRVPLTRQCLEQTSGLFDVEGEVGPVQLEHLALPAQALDREGRLRP